jgi:chorismate mutase
LDFTAKGGKRQGHGVPRSLRVKPGAKHPVWKTQSTPDNPGGNPPAAISKLRLAIDEIDAQIMDLINRRLQLAKQVGGLKKQGGIRITDSAREKQIIDRLLQKNHGLLSDDGLEHIFTSIIAEGRNVQKRIECQND